MIYLCVLFCVAFPAYESVYQPGFRPAESGRPGMMIINRGEDQFDEFTDSFTRAKRAAPGAPAAATTAAPATLQQPSNTIMPNNDWMGKNITTKVSAKYFIIAVPCKRLLIVLCSIIFALCVEYFIKRWCWGPLCADNNIHESLYSDQHTRTVSPLNIIAFNWSFPTLDQ